jgi:hypothetical protein
MSLPRTSHPGAFSSGGVHVLQSLRWLQCGWLVFLYDASSCIKSWEIYSKSLHISCSVEDTRWLFPFLAISLFGRFISGAKSRRVLSKDGLVAEHTTRAFHVLCWLMSAPAVGRLPPSRTSRRTGSHLGSGMIEAGLHGRRHYQICWICWGMLRRDTQKQVPEQAKWLGL